MHTHLYFDYMLRGWLLGPREMLSGAEKLTQGRAGISASKKAEMACVLQGSNNQCFKEQRLKGTHLKFSQDGRT